MSTLNVRNVAIQRSNRIIVNGMSFSADRGETIALMGPSGTGKTTLLRAIAGLEPIASGEIEIDGVRLVPGNLPEGKSKRELYRRVGMVFQFHHLFEHMTAIQNVCLAPIRVLGRPRAQAESDARQLLGALGVAARADALPHELSGGEAQRVAIARALALEPPVLLMDEPTASLDQARREDLAAIVRRLAEQGRVVVMATHDVDFARLCADRTVTLAGQLTEVDP